MLMRLDLKKSRICKTKSLERERTYTKYNKLDTTLSIVETIAVGGAAAAGSIGIASLASVVAAPVGFILEGIPIGLVGMEMVMKFARSKIHKTFKKHDEIRVIAESKLITINSHLSKAVEDGHISQEEFLLINEERAKYSEMKEHIRSKFMPEESPKESTPDIKPIDDKEKIYIKRTNRKTIQLKIHFSKNKSCHEDVLIERIKRLEQRLREIDRPPAYNSNFYFLYLTNSSITLL